MFESDDFDQVLSQFDFPDVLPEKIHLEKYKDSKKENSIQHTNNESLCQSPSKTIIQKECTLVNKAVNSNILNSNSAVSKFVEEPPPNVDTFVSPKHCKRKIINSYFDHQSKRKFPGPAGLLTSSLKEPKDERICEVELLSQDIDCTQQFRKDVFESPIWKRLMSDIKEWHLKDVDSIKAIKQLALGGNLRRRKAQTVTAFIVAVDRSAVDPLVILRDDTGTIKCTLHRDAWSTFSPHIVSEYCALVLQNPTILTTGTVFKKHYLNITLSNIFAIYSSSVLKDESKILPDGYNVVSEDDYTVIKLNKTTNETGNLIEHRGEELLDDLDDIFSDDLF